MTRQAADASVYHGDALVAGEASGAVLASDVELSLWGGVDPATGRVIDRHHPLCGEMLRGRILAIPGGRGSSSSSGVLLELLLNGHGPAALVLERADDILALGVIVAEEVFAASIPVLVLEREHFRAVRAAAHARIAGNAIACAAEPASLREPPRTASAEADADDGLTLEAVDQDMFAGRQGPAAAAAMRILVRLARLQGAERFIDVSRVHIDGCIYTGPASLRFAEQLRDLGARVAVPTTLNALSVDHRHWRAQGVDPGIGEPASRLGDAYIAMGAQPTFTCAPYLLDEVPARGEQIAWAESNAVVFANSVLGARTLKYPDYLDLCIALTGRAPQAGCHRDAHRRAGVCLWVPARDTADDAFYPLLGHCAGRAAADRVPALIGLESADPSTDDLKAFGAAFATTSGAAMFHIVGVTPEAPTLEAATGGAADLETVTITRNDLRADWQALNSAEPAPVDLVSLGNPHFSLSECLKLRALCAGRQRHQAVRLVITCSRAIHEQARAAGAVAALEAFGAEFVTDTCWCMIGEPLIPPHARVIMTNSAKYAHYGPGMTGRAFRFAGLADCVEAAVTGCAPAVDPFVATTTPS